MNHRSWIRINYTERCLSILAKRRVHSNYRLEEIFVNHEGPCRVDAAAAAVVAVDPAPPAPADFILRRAQYLQQIRRIIYLDARGVSGKVGPRCAGSAPAAACKGEFASGVKREIRGWKCLSRMIYLHNPPGILRPRIYGVLSKKATRLRKGYWLRKWRRAERTMIRAV